MGDEIRIGRAHRTHSTDVGDIHAMHKATPLVDEDIHAVPEFNVFCYLCTLPMLMTACEQEY
jgi:hypothetical protein